MRRHDRVIQDDGHEPLLTFQNWKRFGDLDREVVAE
jgi:hypothetical protein